MTIYLIVKQYTELGEDEIVAATDSEQMATELIGAEFERRTDAEVSYAIIKIPLTTKKETPK